MLHDRQFLCNGLAFVYRMMVASAPLLEFAIPRTEGGLLEYYKQHLEEERGHDLMLLDDLKRLGVEEVPLSHEAAQLAGSQYYLIAHEHPALLLGYMHALERQPMSVEQVDALSRLHGTQLTALRHHAIHDIQHKADLEAQMDVLPLELRAKVLWNEMAVSRLLGRA
jgi:hypothetical protein